MPLDIELARLDRDLSHDLLRFLPELLVCLGVLGGLFAKLFRPFAKLHLVPFAILLLVVALLFASSDELGTDAFRGLLRLDLFANFFRSYILLTALLVLTLARLTGLPDALDSADFITLLLGATLGMMLMVSASHLLMIFLAVEMASLPSYVLAGFLKGKSQSSEAALKYVIYGASASGVMLYGMSLLMGLAGSGDLVRVSFVYSNAVETGQFGLPLAAATLFVGVGLGFKLAAFPFHFWLPDVFTGAAAEVGALLSTASKAAAIGLTIRLLYSCFEAFPFGRGTESLATVLAVVAALTASLGNLAALVQTNFKRLLAYSTIAHAGYMLMGIACLRWNESSAVLFYLLGYLPMTLGAFAVVAIVRNFTGSEELDAARGLLSRSPALGISLAICLFSLLGLPPLVGFAGKFQIFMAIYRTGNAYTGIGHPWLGTLFYGLLAVGIVNTVISAGYYLKVLKIIGLDDPPTVDEKGHAIPLGEPFGVRLYLGLLGLSVIVMGVWWNPLIELATRAVSSLRG